MVAKIHTKLGKIQFVGVKCVPPYPQEIPCDQGIAFHEDCCPCDCVTITDQFERPNSTDLGSNWQECSGDWQIVSNQMVAYGLGVVTWKHMEGDQVGKFTVYLKDITVGTVFTIRAFYGSYASPCNATASWKLKFTKSTATTGKLELLSTDGGVSQSQDITAMGTEFGMYLCVGPERIFGGSTHTYHLLSCLCTDAFPENCSRDGYWFALENESSETVKVEFVTYIDHYSHVSSCPACECGCQGYCFPETLFATLRNNYLCTRQDGKTFTLTKDPYSCTWRMDSESWGTRCCIELVLSGGSADEYGEPTEWGLTDLSGSTTPIIAQVGSTCDPIYLLFGPVRNYCDMPSSGGDCPGSGSWMCCEGDCASPGCPYNTPVCRGTYYIEITETPDEDAFFEDGSNSYWDEDGTNRYWE